MDSGLIGKIAKARRYAEERGRFTVRGLRVQVRGDHDEHEVRLEEGRWRCGCGFFSGHETCAHTMAVERLLAGVLAADSNGAAA